MLSTIYGKSIWGLIVDICPLLACHSVLSFYRRILQSVLVLFRMGLLPDTQNCGLRMRRECRERFPRHRGLTIPACTTAPARPHVPWCLPGSLTHGLLWGRWRGKRSRHCRRMRSPQFYVSDKRQIARSRWDMRVDRLLGRIEVPAELQRNVILQTSNLTVSFVYLRGKCERNSEKGGIWTYTSNRMLSTNLYSFRQTLYISQTFKCDYKFQLLQPFINSESCIPGLPGLPRIISYLTISVK